MDAAFAETGGDGGAEEGGGVREGGGGDVQYLYFDFVILSLCSAFNVLYRVIKQSANTLGDGFTWSNDAGVLVIGAWVWV